MKELTKVESPRLESSEMVVSFVERERSIDIGYLSMIV